MSDLDVIVVGAGSAGAVLAARLSEDPRRRVALIEAGGRDRSPWLHIPIGYFRTMYDPRVAWKFMTEPEASSGDRSMPWPRGKVLGGSSAINGLLYIRGQREDYDHWRQLGCVGWGWGDVLPYFRRSEDQERGADELHGRRGPLAVQDIRIHHPFCAAFIDAAVAAGVPRNDDFNGGAQEGVGYYQLTTRNGLRCSTAVGYLKPARRRANLRVITDALVARVVLEGRRAVGIAYHQDGKEQVLRGREIVLCAGAIGSPQILQLSGIGPAAMLKDAGVAVAHDLPGVGANLQDHYQARFVHEMNQRISINDRLRSPWQKVRMALQWALFRSGEMTVGAGQVGLFARVHPRSSTPDVQFHVFPVSMPRPGGQPHEFSGFTTSVCQLRPESRGSIALRDGDPATPPVIRPNYLSAAIDREVLLGGLKLARRIMATSPIAGLVTREVIPGPRADDDAGLMAFARDTGGTIFHPVGTCKMGHDDMAVVDDRLRVRGVTGLRVADAAIMPTLVSGNTNAPAIMIGEKAADMIAADLR